MLLRVKSLKWSAGFPVAMLSKETADKMGIHEKDRISIRTLSKKHSETLTIVDTAEGIVGKNQIGISSEIKKRSGLVSHQKVDVNLAEMPASLSYIKKKLDGNKLSKDQIDSIIKDITNNSLSEAEIALFISAIYSKGMDFSEIIFLIKAILRSGNMLKINRKLVADKHSIGGIPGNRTTPIVVSICAAAGLTMPKTSSRAITSAAGTADVIESIAKVEFSMKEIKKIVQKTGACMVWGGSLGMVPADDKMIQIEKILKIDPKPNLLASIMSKKLAMGSKYILIDIPYGLGAKVNKREAMALKKDFEYLGKHFKKKLKVVLTKGDEPIGNGIGSFLELIDVLNVLDSKKSGPLDLEKKSLFLSGELLELTGKSKKGKGIELAKSILYSGKAFEKFKEIIKAQGGKADGLTPAKFRKDILSPRTSKIKEIKNKEINLLARICGCPVDRAAGLYLYFHTKDEVKKGEKLITLYSESKTRLNEAVKFYMRENPIVLYD